MKLIEVPKTTKIAGPMQHEAARSEAIIIPAPDIFSVFTTILPSTNQCPI